MERENRVACALSCLTVALVFPVFSFIGFTALFTLEGPPTPVQHPSSAIVTLDEGAADGQLQLTEDSLHQPLLLLFALALVFALASLGAGWFVYKLTRKMPED